MIRNMFSGLALLILSSMSNAQIELKYEENKTLTYYETINAYKYLDSISEISSLIEYGKTDIGKPLHLFVISQDKDFDPGSLKSKNKSIILINNGIHPGESCGVDASVQFASDIISNKDELASFLKNTVICIVPLYNIGGALNRTCCSRANQNGPEEKGFRGNAKNLDLNRDFIKCDTRNAKSFIEIFHTWNPDIFVDTHTSNGADYQYVMTLLTTQHNKMQKDMGKYLKKKMTPWLFNRMKEFDYEMTPYVEWNIQTPEKGLIANLDLPRFSSGFAALFNTFSFTTEAHMLKPFPERVKGTYYFLRTILEFTSEHSQEILDTRQIAFEEDVKSSSFPIKWELDTTKSDLFYFKGYTAEYYTSSITGDQRLYYNRDKPWEKMVPYFDYYNSKLTITKPNDYLIPQAWNEVIERLKLNGVELQQIKKDTIIDVNAYFITSYTVTKRPYYYHYPIQNIEVEMKEQSIQFYKGDYVVNMNQEKNRFVISVLEPQFEDSYFSWNFFQSILNQKEWFSPYIFEDYALDLLSKKPALKEELDKLKAENDEFANNSWQQLYFIYKNSEFYEPYLNRYPVYRLEEEMYLPVE